MSFGLEPSRLDSVYWSLLRCGEGTDGEVGVSLSGSPKEEVVWTGLQSLRERKVSLVSDASSDETSRINELVHWFIQLSGWCIASERRGETSSEDMTQFVSDKIDGLGFELTEAKLKSAVGALRVKMVEQYGAEVVGGVVWELEAHAKGRGVTVKLPPVVLKRFNLWSLLRVLFAGLFSIFSARSCAELR